MILKNNKQLKRRMRHKKIRMKIIGTAKRPRLSVFKSNRHLYIQIIDDDAGKTLVSVSDKGLLLRKKIKKTAKILPYDLGKFLAKKALDIGINEVVFDRGGYKFHGAILQIAKGAREEGLKF